MPAVAAAIAAAILADLTGHTFSPPITAARRYLPDLDLRAMDGVRVTVVPRSNTITNADRSRVANEIAVDVAVQKKLLAVSPEEVDPLMELVQHIADFLTRRPLPTVPGASWLRIANQPIYAPEHLQDKRLFTSVLTVTYIVHR
jgi:hypothetical protein